MGVGGWGLPVRECFEEVDLCLAVLAADALEEEEAAVAEEEAAVAGAFKQSEYPIN